METFLTVLIVYLIANTIIWVLRHRTLSGAEQTSALLDSGYPVGGGKDLPTVSMMVAARNEADNIERCLKSLVGQGYERLEIIAIDDHSEDQTGELIDRLADESGGRLRGLRVTEVRDGWLGKCNAMAVGVERASGQWLCFTDADCFFVCPETIGIAVEYARSRGIDLLSILPVLETSSFWERVLQPVCSAVMMIWFRPERVNKPPQQDASAYANGAFMLFRRECYEAIGGHEAVKDQMNEDMQFARLVKSSGRSLHVVQGRDLYRTRMYDGFRPTFAGWSRIFRGCFVSLGRVLVAAALLLFMSVLPYGVFLASLVAAIMGGWSLSDVGWYVFAWAGLAIAAQMSVIARFYSLMGINGGRVFTYPLGAVVTLGMLVNAAGKCLGGKMVWRGRRI